jgi:hypothetical protein
MAHIGRMITKATRSREYRRTVEMLHRHNCAGAAICYPAIGATILPCAHDGSANTR